ncbi:MAG: cation-translocating P-type ATPase, partial [Ruminococcaceae bacterium]|nr:cation-translocating P-type ATPase [Oscillospiraceae bacterium]
KEKKKKSPLALFLSQFKDILIVILAASTILSFVVGQLTEAVAIIVIMLLNAVMGFVQEYRTERTLESLKGLTAPVARVYRDGALKRINASAIVAGDVCELKAGDRVPADCTLLSGASVRTDESMLSGESETVEKKRGDVLFMGTSVMTGHAAVRVTATGMRTEMGKISEMIDESEEKPTPLQFRLKALGGFIAVTCVLCGAAVMLLGVLRGESFLSMMLTGISLAVAAIPEGLPAVVTVVLALSVNRILSRGAIIRRLHAVETLGCASVICTEKKGTVTENKMTVTDIFTLDGCYLLSGGGDSPTGELILNGAKTPPDKAVSAALTAAVVCSTAGVEKNSSGSLSCEGSPTEAALLVAAYKLKIYKNELLSRYEVIRENPFDSARKMMSVVAKSSEGSVVFVKGASDVVLERCVKVLKNGSETELEEKDALEIKRAIADLSDDAKRVIVVARGNERTGEEGLTFLALCGISDPPRHEVAPAVRRCRAAGIRPIMITGDHALTARAVAKSVGIARENEGVLTGTEIEAMSDAELEKRVRGVSVFARVSPGHKLRIVRALKKDGSIVAMTGDGVNDAPAIKEADIGVAMGISGSDVTKEASSVVILDDNFATIVSAVEEGRIIYKNIRRFIKFLLTSNLGEVLTVVLAMAMRMPVVFAPIQILLINLVTDGLPSVALGMEKGSSGVMSEPPRRANEGLFAGGMAAAVVLRGAVLGLCNLLCFSTVLRLTGVLEVARSATFLTLILAQMIHVFECKFEDGGFSVSEIFSNRLLVAASLSSIAVTVAVIYLPFLQKIFLTCAVTGTPLLVSLGCVALSVAIGLLGGKFPKRKGL